MKINWKVRIKNKNFWITIIPMLLLLIQAVLAIFDIKIDIGDLGNKLIAVVNILFGILAALGIVNDPTTTGMSDSERAMTYDKPK